MQFSKGQKRKGSRARCRVCVESSRVESSHVKQCPKCKETKPKKLFSLWRGPLATIRCTDCARKEQAVKEAAKKEVERKEQEEELARKQKFWKTRCKMPTFEYPLQTTSDHYCEGKEEVPQRPTLKYREREGSEEALVGIHDLLFLFTQAGEETLRLNRAIMGFVVFVKKEEEEAQSDEEQSYSSPVHGAVLIDKSLKKDLEEQWTDWNFDMEGESSFEVTDTDDPLQYQELRPYGGWEHNGTIYTVDEPIVLPYGNEGPRYWIKPHQSAYRKTVPTEIAAAQKMIEEYQSGESVELKWLSKIPNVSLPEEVSRLISVFASCKPPPALILQKGDLVLEFPWMMDHYGPETYIEFLVARPRSDSRAS